jgi:hypothetical protein
MGAAGEKRGPDQKVNPAAVAASDTLDADVAAFYARVERHWQDHRAWKWRLRWIHVGLGLTAASLGGAAAVTAIKEAPPLLVATLAALSAFIGAVQSLLRPPELLAFHMEQEVDYEEIMWSLRDLRRQLAQNEIGQVEAQAKFAELRTAMFAVKRRGAGIIRR